MKNRYRSALFSLVMVCSLIAAPILSTGCKSAEKTAYVATGSLAATANAAIGAYNEYRISNNIPNNSPEVQKARVLIQQYYTAVEASRKSVAAYKSGQGSKQAADLALDAVEASASDVIALINSIIHK